MGTAHAAWSRRGVIVTELSDATANDAAPSVRTDGREIFFGSTRSHGLGSLDIWFSTRRSVHEPGPRQRISRP